MDEDPDEYVWIGAYESSDAQRALDALQSKGIPFVIEQDDSSIRGLTPFTASIGGTFGHGALLVIRVPIAHESTARQTLSKVFPEQI